MTTLTDAWDWLTDSAHWAGQDGIGQRLLEHLVLTVVCLLISCLVTTTTDATLDEFGLVLLADDKHLQNADYVVLVVNRARAGSEWVGKALGRLNDVLTTADLASMNQQVDSWRLLATDVARTYLQDKGLLK